MTIEFMRDLLSKDEKITVEYKTCQYGIQEDVYETVCSFSNRYGGYIYDISLPVCRIWMTRIRNVRREEFTVHLFLV